jgi:L-lactate dehydrogenase
MKIGVIGTGYVGATAAYAMVMRGVGSELILVDKNQGRAQAEADDIFHAVPFAEAIRVRYGDYPDLAGCGIVVLCAGVNQQPGETRIQLLGRNAAIFKAIVPQILDHAPNAILVVATNPVDIMTHLTARYAAERGIPSHRVIGSGTTLDTARYRALLGEHLGINPQNVHGYVVGEHGDSEVLTWSTTTVGTVPLAEFCTMRDVGLTDEVKARIDEGVRRAAYRIIQGKGATYYGIGSALARIVSTILGDQRSVLTVCTPRPEIAGVKDVTVSLPHLVGGEGIIDTFPLPLSDQEAAALHRSANVIRDLIDHLG